MKRFILCIIALVGGGVPATAIADTYFDLHIPASACRPIQADMAKVKLSDGGWVFDTGQSGTVMLYCPLHLAAHDALGYSSSMAVMRLWYKDPDATANNSRVSAVLKRRKYDATTDSSVGGVIQSNNNNESGFTLYNVTLNHNASFNDYTYHVEVLMNRSSSLITTPVFVGLDWQPPAT